MGVVLAALIIGAALMMQVQTTFRILEYPGVAILLFGAAAFGACVLLLDILYYDDKRKVSLRAAPDREPPE
jgi:ubiquinone biosynthesis protein